MEQHRSLLFMFVHFLVLLFRPCLWKYKVSKINKTLHCCHCFVLLHFWSLCLAILILCASKIPQRFDPNSRDSIMKLLQISHPATWHRQQTLLSVCGQTLSTLRLSQHLHETLRVWKSHQHGLSAFCLAVRPLTKGLGSISVLSGFCSRRVFLHNPHL